MPDPYLDDPSTRIILGLSAVLVLVVVAHYAMKPKRHPGLTDGLENNGWILYTRPNCGYCQQQKAILGKRFLSSPGNVIDCDPTAAAGASWPGRGAPRCGDPRIVGYPFWFNRRTGNTKVGLQDAKELRAMAATRSS